MKKAELTLSAHFKVGDVDPRIYGSFVEHMGRCVYHGLYEPSHPLADENGFRKDVIDLVRPLQIPILRYPGGNFVSGYHWEDGVGPRDRRPSTLDPAWHSVECNQMGTDEFHKWADMVGSSVMMAVNLGTRGPEEAAALLEYCNFPKGTKYANMRAENGHDAPYNDRVWCLGNEMDGIWQIGHRSMDDYAQTARKAACIMKMMDPSLELVACGSSNFDMPTFGKWEAAVLGEAYDFVDYVSLHQYLTNSDTDSPSYLACTQEMDSFIDAVIAICDHVQSMRHSRHQINLSFDEWNVWTVRNRCNNDENWWKVGPRREEYLYSLEDALVFGQQLISLLKHCDRVKMACQAQLINVAGMIMTEDNGPAWAQTIYYPFLYTSRYGRGSVLEARLSCDGYDTRRYGSVPSVESVAVSEEEEGTVTVFAVNRLPEAQELTICLDDFPQAQVIEHVVLENADKDAINTADHPMAVCPHAGGQSAAEGCIVRSMLPGLSWNMVRLKVR